MLPSHRFPAFDDQEPTSQPEGAGQTARQPRTNLFLSAQLILPGRPPCDVRIRNLSPSGARIDMAPPPAAGSTLVVRRGAAEEAAQVMWSAEGNCGLRSTHGIDVARWMSDRPMAAAASIARPTLAEELALARQLVDRLEEALASEPAIIAELGTELQAIDLLSQLLRHSEKRAAGSTSPAIHNVWQAAANFLRQPRAGSRRSLRQVDAGSSWR